MARLKHDHRRANTLMEVNLQYVMTYYCIRVILSCPNHYSSILWIKYIKDIKEFSVVKNVPDAVYGGQGFRQTYKRRSRNDQHASRKLSLKRSRWSAQNCQTIHGRKLGQTYLLVNDYFSHFPEVIRLTTTTSSKIITSLKSLFTRHGIPEEVISDNVPNIFPRRWKRFRTHMDLSTQQAAHGVPKGMV